MTNGHKIQRAMHLLIMGDERDLCCSCELRPLCSSESPAPCTDLIGVQAQILGEDRIVFGLDAKERRSRRPSEKSEQGRHNKCAEITAELEHRNTRLQLANLKLKLRVTWLEIALFRRSSKVLH
jgi:hypothetical protein